MSESKIEKLICSKDFSYLQPYFYNNKYALRCELGMGKTEEEYYANAKKRAYEIYNILFPNGADAMIFDYCIYDLSGDGEAKKNTAPEDISLADIIRFEGECASEMLSFLIRYQYEYRHIAVKDLPLYEDSSEECIRRNRIVCFSDGKGFDLSDLIDRQLNENDSHDIGLVSFENECILSVYDSRGCDVVFATHEKMREFFDKLKPYFLDYDTEEMKRRYNS